MKTLAATALLGAAMAARAEPASYVVDTTHAAVFYEIGHFGTSTNRGRFPVKEGTVQLDRAGKSGRAEITIDVGAVNSGVPALDKHLAGKDFFNAAEFPTAGFVADRFVFNGDKVAEVAGQLTLQGRTNPVTLKAVNFNCYTNPLFKREVCGGDFEATVQRSLWGLNWGLGQGFADAVHLIVQVEAIKQ